MKTIFVYIYVILCASILYSQEKIPYIFSKQPKYENIEYVTLEKLYTIPLYDESEKASYFIANFRNMDTDSDTNLYVLDNRSCNINVFDKNGKYIRTLGGKGQGPGELEAPDWLFIGNNDRLYVNESYKGTKIIDKNGKYINFYVLQSEHYDYSQFKIYNDYLYTLEIKIKNNTLCINKISLDFKKSETFTYVESESKSEKLIIPHSINYLSWNMDSNGYIYFSRDPKNSYKIEVFNNLGTFVYSFGREYKKIPFSDSYLEHMKNAYKNIDIEIEKYPSIISYFFIDRDKCFVVVGESTLHLNNPFPKFKITSTIDVFNTNGELLYTFKSPYFSFNSLVKQDRLYSAPSQDDINIHVFKINYLK